MSLIYFERNKRNLKTERVYGGVGVRLRYDMSLFGSPTLKESGSVRLDG